MYITVAHWLGVQMGARLIHHSGTVVGGTDGDNPGTTQWLEVLLGQGWYSTVAQWLGYRGGKPGTTQWLEVLIGARLG